MHKEHSMTQKTHGHTHVNGNQIGHIQTMQPNDTVAYRQISKCVVVEEELRSNGTLEAVTTT